MAHGEAEHGCAQGEPCRPGHHEQQAAAKHRRPSGGFPAHSPEHPARAAERPDDDVAVPRQRLAEPATTGEAEPAAVQGCRSDLSGWAGAHRHGPVRPRQRVTRREGPPRRWC
ncbi:hypothetical protein OG777_17630 [Micromonospora peucetia]|uniref:Uncharacterized protein n=1 Tax=Micromonospora peucetia TaxID=47871 RepID=A0A1C6VM69_9ACTN|nr:hypothetical protein [Micromonospora peucetia]MCX4388741.1 hypothetical protein [Micromonospora peucetia]WSA30623.1 hypothetical protein OIE14_20875 [Micromonospora peucetia]SCL67428.1 hypothetical protein GA0070608_3506 [Micromonospora peucetia]